MSRIDVRQDGKSFRVLFNFMQHGATLHSAVLANRAASDLQKNYPSAELHLVELDKA